MAIEYNFTLDMDRSKRDNNIAYARTGDVDSITINADLVLNGTAYTPTGTNAFFECITPNGHSIRAAAEKIGSTVSIEVPSAAFQAAGVINVAYFRFESGEADNPTYVESTEPFAIVVREGIGDDVDIGDYIEEWRQLADSLDEIAKEVQQKATQAQTSIAKDTVAVENAKTQAISNIDSSQVAVDAAINQLEEKTQEAVDAAQEALDGTLATDLKNEINRTLKLDVADMVNISDNTSLSSFTAVGSYCCKTASAAATIDDCPIDDSPFNMYVFSSATSGQVMQLVVPIDLQGRSSAEWYVRFGTSSAMDMWSVIGGMPDIVPVSQGGTGATTAAQARQNLGAGTSDFSGSYNDLTDKPTIPEQPDDYLHTVSATDGRLLRGESGNITNINVSDSPDENGVAKLCVSSSDTAQAYASAIYYDDDRSYAIVKSSAHDPRVAGAGQVSAEVLGQNPQGSQFNMAVTNATSSTMHDKIQFFMRQQDADGTVNKQAQFLIDYSGQSSVGSASVPWDMGYFGGLQLTNALGIAYGGTGATTAAEALENLGVYVECGELLWEGSITEGGKLTIPKANDYAILAVSYGGFASCGLSVHYTSNNKHYINGLAGTADSSGISLRGFKFTSDDGVTWEAEDLEILSMWGSGATLNVQWGNETSASTLAIWGVVPSKITERTL